MNMPRRCNATRADGARCHGWARKGGKCPDCGLDVDTYGNTEDSFENCSFPDCGCDGSRLCMAGEPNEHAQGGNVEGMWSGRTYKQRRAAFDLIARVSREDLKEGSSE